MAWDPSQYEKFRAERMAPFHDLLALVRPRPAMRVVDLGCGTGELTALLADLLPGAVVEGVDSSEEMLEKARPRASDRVRFRLGDAAEFADAGAVDLVFSHAALHWVPDHEAFLPRLLDALPPGAQLAVQMPKNERHASHAVARALGREEPFRTWLGGYEPRSHALELERYAELLHAHGLRDATCAERIYGHVLPRATDVVEWTRGTLLLPYLERLDAARQASFLDAYRERLVQAIGDASPYFFTFRRMLLHAEKR